MRNVEISEKSKIKFTIPLFVSFFALVFAVGGGYTSLSQELSAVDKKAQSAVERCEIHAVKLQTIERDRNTQNIEIMKMIQEIRESQIRIEGKLDLKQDRFK